MEMRIARGLLIAVGMSLVLTGCAKSHAGSGVATAAKGTVTLSASPKALSDAEMAEKFGDCMRANGVPNFVDPKINGGGMQMNVPEGTPKETVDAAMAKCRQYLPNGGQPPKQDPAMVEQARKFSQCMRDHGLPNFPDPGADGGVQLDLGKLGVSGPDDPRLTAAQSACEHLLPAPPSGAAGPQLNDGPGGNVGSNG